MSTSPLLSQQACRCGVGGYLLSWDQIVFFAIALAVAFGFELINGFHDTADGIEAR